MSHQLGVTDTLWLSYICNIISLFSSSTVYIEFIETEYKYDGDVLCS